MTNRINKGEVSVALHATDDMTDDFFTNTNQVVLFRRFRDLIMGVKAQPDPGPGKSKKVRTSTRSKSSNVKRDQLKPAGTTWPQECVRLPWVPDGRCTYAVVSTAAQQSLCRATYLR